MPRSGKLESGKRRLQPCNEPSLDPVVPFTRWRLPDRGHDRGGCLAELQLGDLADTVDAASA